MLMQYFEPRPVGSRFVKKHGKFLITYEVIGHMPGVRKRSAREMLDEVSREKIIN